MLINKWLLLLFSESGSGLSCILSKSSFLNCPSLNYAQNTMKLKTSLNFRNNFDGYKAVNQGKYHQEGVSCTKIRRTKQAY